MQIRNPAGIIFDMAEPILWLLARRYIMTDFIKVSHGTCCFNVLPEHRNIVDKALFSLKKIDEELYLDIRRSNLCFFYEDPNHKFYECPINNRFHIKSWMIRDGLYSVLFGVVVAYFHVKSMRDLPLFKRYIVDPRRFYLESYDRMIAWMRSKRFQQKDIEYAENCWYYYKDISRDVG